MKKSDKYYTQVQGQLNIAEKEFSDFVIWTPKGIIIHRIYRDIQFLGKIGKEINRFFVQNVLPEIMIHKLLGTTTIQESNLNIHNIHKLSDDSDLLFMLL